MIKDKEKRTRKKGQGGKAKGERTMDDGRWKMDDGGQKIISSEAEKVRATRAKKDLGLHSWQREKIRVAS